MESIAFHNLLMAVTNRMRKITMELVVKGFVYKIAYCPRCHKDVEMIPHSISQMDYLDLDCYTCGIHLITLHREGPQDKLELDKALRLARVP